MVINGVSFFDDIPAEEVDGASVKQNGDFSMLLFVMLGAASPQDPPLPSVAESLAATVPDKRNANREASSHLSMKILDANSPVIKTHILESYGCANRGTEGSQGGHFNLATFAVDVQFCQSILLQPEAALREIVRVSTTSLLDTGEEAILASMPRNLWFRSGDPLADVDSLGLITLAKLEGTTAPKEFFPTRDCSMDSVTANLPPEDKRLRQTDMVADDEVIPGILEVRQHETYRLPSYSAAANEKMARTIFESAGRAVSEGEPHGIVGYSLHAKDTVATLSNEHILARDGGSKLGPQLLMHAENELHSRSASRADDCIGEIHLRETQQETQGQLYQNDDRKPSHKRFSLPAETLIETASHHGMPFQVAYAEDKAPIVPARESQNVNWPAVIDRVVGEISGQIQIGKQEAVLQLDPPELGKLRIDLYLDGDRLTARILAETQAARTLIEAHLPELRQALGESRAELVEVCIDSGSWAGPRGDGQQEARQETSGGRQTAHDFNSIPGELGNGELARRAPTLVEAGRVSMWA